MSLSRQTPARAGVFSLALVLLLSACAAPQTRALLEEAPQYLQAGTRLDATPFFPQEDYQCGPAALATVLVSAGVAVTPEALVPQVYLPAREGSLQAEMLAATRRQGLVAYVLAPRLADLIREINAGHPVVVLQNLSLPSWPRWHYAVAMGYDRETVLLRSGITRELAMSLDSFEHTWARSGHWALLALAPEVLPATARESDYVAATAALERVMPAAASRAYRTALSRWPGNLVAQIGLGNVAYADRDLAGAEAAYRGATVAHPDAADAWNNLAQVLHELGRNSEARIAGERAVALGGPRQAGYRATLQAITEALAP